MQVNTRCEVLILNSSVLTCQGLTTHRCGLLRNPIQAQYCRLNRPLKAPFPLRSHNSSRTRRPRVKKRFFIQNAASGLFPSVTVLSGLSAFCAKRNIGRRRFIKQSSSSSVHLFMWSWGGIIYCPFRYTLQLVIEPFHKFKICLRRHLVLKDILWIYIFDTIKNRIGIVVDTEN
jgi:hypothetical protein